MKKYIYIISILLVLIISCEDALKEEIVSGITTDVYFNTPANINNALTAGYAELKSFFGQDAHTVLTESGTDIYGRARNDANAQMHLYDVNMNASVGYIKNAWRTLYRAINIYNTIINRAPALITNEADLKRILGEARFLRGLTYFYLVQIWGDVTLTTTETVGAVVEATRTPADDIYNNIIIPDLDFAIDNLPPTTTNFGRATQPAAKAIRARVAMVLQDWPKGYTLAKSVITDYSNLKLTNTYSEIWDVTKENSSEIIFSVQFSVDQLVSGQNLNCVYFTPWYSKHPGIPQNPVDGGTWVMFKPTPYFYTLWDKTKDRRYAEGLKSVWLARSKATGKNGQTINIGDTALFYSIDVLSTAWKNSRKYAVYDVNDMPADDSAWPQPTKFRDETHTSNSLKLGRDVPVVRVAEMYLLAAEAAFRQDDITEARDLLNALRTKRAITGQDMSITSGQVSLDFILDEMGRELFGEGERWFVLKRMGKLVERVKLYNPYGAAANIQDFHTLRPIPQDQIDRTKGGYPQNTGYN